jgi:CHASE2 domain-containing sensor protein
MSDDKPDAPQTTPPAMPSRGWLAWTGSTGLVRLLVAGKSTRPVRREHLVYWTLVAITIGCLFAASHYLSEYVGFIRFGFDHVLHKLSPNPQDPIFTVLVVIDDDEYYGKELAHRRPMKRRYLANLIEEVAKFNPAVIALDIKLHSPDKEGKRLAKSSRGITLPVDEEYVEETVDLCEAIKRVVHLPNAPRVVLTRFLEMDGDEFGCVSDAYNGFAFDSRKVSHGFINLDEHDRRCVTPLQRLGDQTTLDAFSMAAVRGLTPQRCQQFAVNADYYTGLVGPQKFTRILAGDLRKAREKDDKQKLNEFADTCAHKIVLIGGEYHTDSFGGHVEADMHPTPLGDFRGLVLHANYIEGMLAGRALPLGKVAVVVIEISLSVILAWIIIAKSGYRRFGWITAIVLFPIALSYFAFFNLGFYWDLSFVLAGLFVDLWLHKKHIFNRGQLAHEL